MAVPKGGEGTLKEVYVASEELLPSSEKGKIKVGSAEIYNEVRTAVSSGDGDLLFVVHGYANSFANGLIGAAEIAEWVGHANAFAFCWPSQDLALGINYGAARRNARISGEAIGRAFAILLGFLARMHKEGQSCDRRIDVIAHSMGNYALRNAVQLMRTQLESDDAVRLIDDLILVAADDDNDTLEIETGIAPIVSLVSNVTVYYSRADWVLQYSDKVKLNPDRLGQTGPRTMSKTADIVVAVDVTDVIKGDTFQTFLDHWCHRVIPVLPGHDSLPSSWPGLTRPSRLLK